MSCGTSNGTAMRSGNRPNSIALSSRGQYPMAGGPMLGQGATFAARPIHMLRYPSFAPPAFDADEPPPPAHFTSQPAPAMSGAIGDGGAVLTPPPLYGDIVQGTPSFNALEDYFARRAAVHNDEAGASNSYEAREGEGSDDSGATGEHRVLRRERSRLTERSGRVNVSNPRSPGPGMTVPSRSFELERPALDMTLSLGRMGLGGEGGLGGSGCANGNCNGNRQAAS